MTKLVRLVAASEAARLLETNISVILKMIEDGDLEAYNVNGEVRVSARDLAEYMRAAGDTSPNVDDGKDPPIISTKIPGAVAWLRKRGIVGITKDRPMRSEILGRNVIGDLPIFMAAVAASYARIEIPFYKASENYDTPEKLDRDGARLVFYKIEQIEDPGIYKPGANGNGRK